MQMPTDPDAFLMGRGWEIHLPDVLPKRLSVPVSGVGRRLPPRASLTRCPLASEGEEACLLSHQTLLQRNVGFLTGLSQKPVLEESAGLFGLRIPPRPPHTHTIKKHF
uniref:Uncharacterized protein n=1 Tax=Sphaerodactylus townsendi TaxID=933632 RepID=A0ACB8ETP9_9SAUR